MMREATLPILFRTLRIDTGYRDTYSMPLLAQRLDDMGYLTRYIIHLALVPLDPDGRWVNPRCMVITPCALHGLLERLPNVRALDLACFTLKRCSSSHECAFPPTPRHMDRLVIQHVRVKGNVDPAILLSIAMTTKTFCLADVLSTERVTATAPAPVLNRNLRSFTCDIALDAVWAKDADGRRKREPRYDTVTLVRKNIEACSSVSQVKLSWHLSDMLRGTVRRH